MSKYFVKVFTDEFNEIEWKDLKPEDVHFIKFKGKLFNEVRHGSWERVGDVTYRCSVCGEISCCNSLFCGDCGARMDVEE